MSKWFKHISHTINFMIHFPQGMTFTKYCDVEILGKVKVKSFVVISWIVNFSEMLRSRTPSQGGGSQGFEMERKYSVPSNPDSRVFSGTTSEDLHAWSIYRQNLNSDFTDSALGSTDKSPLPYGNFQLRDTTVQSILTHPRYGPKYVRV